MRTTLDGRRFDLLVIGGGITGAGVARDAAMRGLQVALVEKDDFASGTSSKSSRLVHGGIRYLEHGQISMVRESVRERETLLRIAPHLVHPLAFTWPVYRGARVSRAKLRVALGVYDLLAGRFWSRSHRMLSRSAIEALEPCLETADLKGGATYQDAATDDARLTLANVLSAEAFGAVTLNHTEALRPISRDRSEWVVDVHDRLTGIETEVRARVIVNATGPWRLNLERRWPQRTAQRRGSKGVHLALRSERVGNRGAITIIHPDDGRVMFVLPSQAHTIIGTTDTWTDEAPDEVRASEADVAYLLKAASTAFPESHLTEDDVVSAWAGIRPLADWEASRNPSAVSREHRIDRNGVGLITVSGGKLTTYRAMAAQIVDTVERELDRKPSHCKTADTVLSGGERSVEIASLIRNEPVLGKSVVPGLPYTLAELRYAVEKELAVTLSDLLLRRTRIAYETHDHGASALQSIVGFVAPLRKWSPDRIREQVDAYEADVERIFGVIPG